MSNFTLPVLKNKDKIHIISPAGSFNGDINAFETTVSENDFKLSISKKALGSVGYFSGTDNDRAKDLQDAIDNPEIKVLLCSRGGYGVSRIIDQIDFSALKKYPKWIIGFSDITAIHLALAKLNIPSIHGPMIKHLFEDKTSLNYLFEFLRTGHLNYTIEPHSSNIAGNCSGKIIGGNLSLLVDSLGTKTQINTKNNILFIEEIGEPLYKIDRMLNQLKRAGIFDRINGLIVGQFTEVKPMTTDFGFNLEDLIIEKIKSNIPVAFNFPAGHSVPNFTVPFCIEANLDVQLESVSLSI